MSRVEWGPMGWATLHSFASIYPDSPTSADSAAASRFLDLFAETITCPTCKEHFGKMLATGKAGGGIFSSRHALFWFFAKCHNIVNSRLQKTQVQFYHTVWARYKGVDFSATRAAYYSYVARAQARDLGFEGIRMGVKVNEMKACETTFKKWFAATDWENNTCQRMVHTNPGLSIELTPEEAARVRVRKPGQGPLFQLPSSPFRGVTSGMWSKIIPGHLR